jgi:hypothetical protein
VRSAGVQEGEKARAIDVDVELHRLPRSLSNAGECVDGDGWIGGVDRRHLVVVLIQDLDAKYLLLDLLMPVSEEFIKMEALTVLPALRDLNRHKALDGAHRFCLRGTCWRLGQCRR